MEFPLFNTKQLSKGEVYDLNDPVERKKYFEAKLGTKIEDVKSFLENNSFVAFLLAKKSAGKGTYSKMFQEIVGKDRVAHLSVGDIVRDVYKNVGNEAYKKELVTYMEKNYRGFLTIEESIDALVGKTQDKLLPTEFILALVKREIEKVGKKALFLDGLPRNMDQISYSLYFRNLIDFREDPDFFVLIDVPTAIIDERMKFRAVCPDCNTSRNTKLLPTKFVKHDQSTDAFYLVCDNSDCVGFGKTRLTGKEGDEKGIELIADRLKNDQMLMEKAMQLQGIPTVLVRNAIPVSEAANVADNYELTPEFYYEMGANGEVTTLNRPWSVKDDNGAECNSLMAAAAVVSMFSQIHGVLFGNK